METDQYKTFWQFSKEAAFKILTTGENGLDDTEAAVRHQFVGYSISRMAGLLFWDTNWVQN